MKIKIFQKIKRLLFLSMFHGTTTSHSNYIKILSNKTKKEVLDKEGDLEIQSHLFRDCLIEIVKAELNQRQVYEDTRTR
jgi:hypothetical protein